MLDDSLADLERQVQSAKRRIAQLEILNNPQLMKVVIKEEPVPPHHVIEGALARVPEWRMANIVHQGQGLDQVNVQSQLRRNGARNLRHFEGMRQTIAEVIG